MDEEVFAEAGEERIVFHQHVDVGHQREGVLEFRQVVDARFGEDLLTHMGPFASLVVEPHRVGDEVDLVVVLVEERDASLKRFREQGVIAVEEGDIASLGCLDARIAGAPHASVGLVDDRDAIVFGGEFGARSQGVVGGTVVDEDDLQLFGGDGLLTKAFDGGGDGVGAVVSGDDDADGNARMAVRTQISPSPCFGISLVAIVSYGARASMGTT